MKAHKEFCKSYKHPKLGCMLFDGSSAGCESCKTVWKAALKWALRQKQEVWFEGSETHGQATDEYLIEEELGANGGEE